jgi:tetratricopeptide (TPR) repeat protein
VTPLASRPHRIAAVVVLVLLAGVGFLPLFGGPGYEQSLASGLVVPAAAAIATALELSASPCPTVLACAAHGLWCGALLAGTAFLTAILHGLRVGICDFWGGTTFFALTAGFGALLGGLWGAGVAEVSRRARRRKLAAILLAMAAPLAGIGLSVARFYGSPMIFAFDPFFGYFSGTLYDTVVDVRMELWTYRAGSTATLVGVLLVACAIERTPQGTLRVALRGSSRRTACLALGVASLVTSMVLSAEGASLGHWQTASTIASALGGRAPGPRCDIVYPDSVLADQVALLIRDCEEQLVAVEHRLGTKLEGRLTAYEFADANQKRRLMGAAETSIAKPWRREIYVQLSSFPHPVLGHEIAHVVAGSFALGPLRVGGGLWPNPGLIEGVAVATSPDDDELTSAQWARAMLDIGVLPPVRELFSLDFLGHSAAKSYTVAGAFVAWAFDRWGTAAVHAWYGGESIETLTGKSWPTLDRAFRDSLAALPMPSEASAYARAKFSQPSVWERKCPHVVDALHRAANQCRDEHRFEQALLFYDRALARDPRNWPARFDRAWVELRYGDQARGRNDLARIRDDDEAPRTWRDRSQEAIADGDLARGRVAEAKQAYQEIAAHTLDEDVGRTLEVKILSAEETLGHRGIVDLLIGEPGHPVDPWLGALSLGEWMGETQEPLPAYLAGRNLMLHGEWMRAATHLDRALERGAPSERIGRELLRDRAICACATGDAEALGRVDKEVRGPDSPFARSAGGRRDWISRLIERCTSR